MKAGFPSFQIRFHNRLKCVVKCQMCSQVDRNNKVMHICTLKPVSCRHIK